MQIKFGTSGWRAVVADEFTFANVRVCIQAIAEHLQAKGEAAGGVVVGSDTRFMSAHFTSLAAEVLAGNGIKAFLCGRDTPTPVISHEILRRKAAGGINFTASHNPPEYNGVKFSPAWGGPALPETTGDIEKRANALLANPKVKTMPRAEAEKKGLIEVIDPGPEYFKTIKSKIDFDVIKKSKMKFLVNPMYGTGRGYLDKLLADAGCDYAVMNDHLDPYFGGLPPEPSEHEIPDMIAKMKKGGFALGLGTDGDADRFGILDGDGRFFEPNTILGMLLDHLVQTRKWPGGVARSVATSHLVDAVARHHKIELFETPVGFKFIGDLISKDKIVMGGEESAGLTIRGHVPEKDGIIACLLVAEMVATRKKGLAAILDELYQRVGTYLTKRLNFRLGEDQKAKLVAKLKNPPTTVAGLKVEKVITIDGTKYLLEGDNWVLMRLSGTEPVVRFYAEARDQATLDKLLAFGNEYVTK